MKSLLDRVPPRWRELLDSFNFWNGIAFIALAILFLWLSYVQRSQAQTEARQAKADAIRIADTHAAASSAYHRCIDSIQPTERISTHVAGVNEAFVVLLENMRNALKVTAMDDPLHRVRVESIAKLEKAIDDVAAVKAFPVPTAAECRERRREALRSAGG